MILDKETNHLYLADCLEKKYPNFFSEFKKVLNSCDIPFFLLPNTKDIWAVDYMPIQVETNKFIQFVYNPDYLKTIKWQKSISNVDSICKAIEIAPIKSNIILDGGNVIKSDNKVIMCDKIFSENSELAEKDLISQLKDLFEIEYLFFVPKDPKDFTGHADGMVRFLDDKTVLINDYSKEKPQFQTSFRMSLHNAGLNYIEIPYSPYDNKKDSHANGAYINFLQMKQAIIVPTFGIAEDDKAVKQLESLFSGKKIVTIDCNELAYQGGILNCISWNIKD